MSTQTLLPRSWRDYTGYWLFDERVDWKLFVNMEAVQGPARVCWFALWWEITKCIRPTVERKKHKLSEGMVNKSHNVKHDYVPRLDLLVLTKFQICAMTCVPSTDSYLRIEFLLSSPRKFFRRGLPCSVYSEPARFNCCI